MSKNQYISFVNTLSDLFVSKKVICWHFRMDYQIFGQPSICLNFKVRTARSQQDHWISKKPLWLYPSWMWVVSSEISSYCRSVNCLVLNELFTYFVFPWLWVRSWKYQISMCRRSEFGQNNPFRFSWAQRSQFLRRMYSICI